MVTLHQENESAKSHEHNLMELRTDLLSPFSKTTTLSSNEARVPQLHV